MAQLIFLIIYLGLCYWVALQGTHTRAGMIGTLLLSVLVTPVLSFIFLYAFSPSDNTSEEVATEDEAGSPTKA